MWVIDSGATCHMTNDRSLLRDIQELTKPIEVQLGDGKVVNATARGTVFLYTILPGGGKKNLCHLNDCSKTQLQSSKCYKSDWRWLKCQL